MENTTATENTPYTLPECTFTAPEGMRFSTWSIGTPDGERKAAGEAIILTDTTSLYAIWETIPHDHSFGTDFETDANEHWNECECGEKANKASHIDDNGDNKCDTCDYAMPAHDPDTPDNPNNTPDNPTDDKDGLGAGAIVGIVIGSVAVVGIGGFAIFWFVIKKKSFADLIAVFKKN